MKKNLKKVFSFFLACVMCMWCAAAASADTKPENALRFNSDGKFKIMMINDTQDVGKGAKPETAERFCPRFCFSMCR